MTTKQLETIKGIQMTVNVDLIMFVKEVDGNFECRFSTGDIEIFKTNPFA